MPCLTPSRPLAARFVVAAALLAAAVPVADVPAQTPTLPATGSSTRPAEQADIVHELRLRPLLADAAAERLSLDPAGLADLQGDGATLWLMAFDLMTKGEAVGDRVSREDLVAIFAPGESPADPTFGAVDDRLIYDLPAAGLDGRPFPADAALRYLAVRPAALETARLAARRREANWAAPTSAQGVAALLPWLNDSRHLANVLHALAKAQAATGAWPAWEETLRVQGALGDAVAHARSDELPVLIESLVGTAIWGLTVSHLREAAALPGAPNFYWALGSLPVARRDAAELFRDSVRGEREGFYGTFPMLRDEAAITGLSPAALARMSEAMAGLARPADDAAAPPPPTAEELEAGLRETEPVARRILERLGHAPAAIDAMTPAERVARAVRDEIEGAYADLARAASLPRPVDAMRALRAVNREAEQRSRRGEALLGPILLPGLTPAYALLHRVGRDVALFRAVEAVRDQVARDGGAVPASLADVTLPVPPDPFTLGEFGYERRDDGFTLTAPAVEGTGATAIVYRVTVVRD